MTAAVTILFLLIFLGSILFVALIYPLWTIISCANSERSKKSKGLWIALMILVWALGSIIYGLFGSGRKVFKIISGVLIGIIILILCLLSFSINILKNNALDGIDHEIANYSSVDISALTQEESTQFKSNLLELKSSFENVTIINFSQKQNDFTVAGFVRNVTVDKVVTLEEYQNWETFYLSKNSTDRKIFLNNLMQFYKSDHRVIKK